MSERFPALPSTEAPEGDEEGESPFETLMGELGSPAFELPTPTCWAEIPLADVPAEWNELRSWVEGLVTRYPHLDVHFIPPCWYRHPSHVETLAALRDHERVSFSEVSPATAPSQFQITMGQIEARLRLYTDAAGCLSTHREPVIPLVPPTDDAWQAWVEADVAHRRMEIIEQSVTTADPPLSHPIETEPSSSPPCIGSSEDHEQGVIE